MPMDLFLGSFLVLTLAAIVIVLMTAAPRMYHTDDEHRESGRSENNGRTGSDH